MDATGAVPGMDTDAGSVLELMSAWDGSAPAVLAPDDALTFGELTRRADVLATALRLRGVRPDEPVGVCLPRSAALVAALFGVLRAGAVYVALDPTQPAARLGAMLADSRVALLVTPAGGGQRVSGADVVQVEGIGELSSLHPTRPADQLPGSAYVMFTSGSTGRPKGAVIGHAGLRNLVRWHGSAFDVHPGVRCSQLGGPGFDASAWEIWGCLGNGGTLVIAPEQVRTDPAGLRDWLVTNRIAVSFVPTPIAEALLALDWPPGLALRTMLTGGDRLTRRPTADLPFRLINNYGLTEATVVSTSGPVEVVDAGDGVPAIGAAIPGVQLRVVDRQLVEVQDGEAGELLVGGVSLAGGYLHEPHLTELSFVSAADGTGPWYRTADLVARRADGQFEHLGRLDEQVQIRGNRVEPGEVVAALDQHPDVARCAVLGLGATPEQMELVAFWEPVRAWAPDPAAGPEQAVLRAYLVERVPSAMVPAQFVRLDALPLTANGKTDRAALAASVPAVSAARDVPSDASGDASGVVSAQPDGDLDAMVGQIIAEVLKVDSVEPDDNFLLIGGHSLLGAQVVARIADRFDVEISLRELFDNPSARGMARLVGDALLAQVLALDDETAERLTQQNPSR